MARPPGRPGSGPRPPSAPGRITSPCPLYPIIAALTFIPAGPRRRPPRPGPQGRSALMSALKLSPCIRAAVALTAVSFLAAADWKPADGPLLTRWAKDVTPDKALPEYPRPQMRRDAWLNLNGIWQLAVA